MSLCLLRWGFDDAEFFCLRTWWMRAVVMVFGGLLWTKYVCTGYVLDLVRGMLLMFIFNFVFVLYLCFLFGVPFLSFFFFFLIIYLRIFRAWVALGYVLCTEYYIYIHVPTIWFGD